MSRWGVSLDIVDLRTGERTSQFENTMDAERFVYQPDNQRFQLIGKETTLVWSLGKDRQDFSFQSQPNLIGVALDRTWTGEFQRRSPQNRVRLNWNGEKYWLPIGQRIGVRLDFASQHRIAAVGTIGGGVFIFHLDGQRAIAPVEPQRSWRKTVFAAMGDRLILASTDGTVAILDCYSRRLNHLVEGTGAHPQQLLVSGVTDDVWIEDRVGLRSIALKDPGKQQRIDGARCAAISTDGSLLAFVKGNEANPTLSVLDLKSRRESYHIQLPTGVSQFTFGDNHRVLFAIDSSGKLVEIDLERATTQAFHPRALDEIGKLDWIQWLGGRLTLLASEGVYSLDCSAGTLEKVDLPGDISSLVGPGWSDRWLAAAPGNVFQFKDWQRTRLQLGSPAQRFSSVALSPCGRFTAVAFGNGRVEIHASSLEAE